ncbi:MAG TPA: glyoxalase/bleomycin resistance/extradiol dioxygenase family protein [Candidatus Thermoplasmatota archaeon]|nr:glyoxalase/bleomycin resistance/extradiol dioxygenase family protein [Candidatus Thermoplasmatota archaeon]
MPAKRRSRSAPKRTAPRRAAKTRAPAAPKPQAVTPYLAVNDAAAAIQWYKDVFGAKVFSNQPAPGGKIMHAGLVIGGSHVLLSDIFPGSDLVDATRTGPSVNLHYYRPNAGHVWERAVEEGAKVTMPFVDQFWGDVYGRIIDPFGHSWAISCKSKLSKAELAKLREKQMKEWSGGA